MFVILNKSEWVSLITLKSEIMREGGGGGDAIHF